MKKVVIIMSLIIVSCLTLTACSEGKKMKADTPINAGLLIESAIDANDYKYFNDLFNEGIKETISKEDFDNFKSITTGGSSHVLYDVITFENGEVLLVRLSPEKVDGEYKVEDVVKLPSEVNAVFNSNK